MANRRASVQAFYGSHASDRRLLLEKTAASASQYAFRGPAVAPTVIVRSDINGYSAWARDKPISHRVALLDAFFSGVVPLLQPAGGIFFRDEGDCLVSVFSDYFQSGATPSSIRAFCAAVASRTYGDDALTVKTAVAYGEVAFFQKAHEAGTDDWSAEGHPFVAAARLEQAIDSKQQIVFYRDEYDRVFRSSAQCAQPGGRYFWGYDVESVQVAGMGLVGGWAEVVRLTYIPGGRVD